MFNGQHEGGFTVSNSISNDLRSRANSGRVTFLRSQTFVGSHAQELAGNFAKRQNSTGKTALVTYLGEGEFRVDIWGVV